MNRETAHLKIIRWDWLFFTAAMVALILFLALHENSNTPKGMVTFNLKPVVRQIEPVLCVVQHCPDFQNVFWLVIINVAGNIAVFMPFGFGLTAAFQHFNAKRFFPLMVAATGFLFSLGIEIAQLQVPGRITDIDDLILNTLGTIAGMALWYALALLGAGKEANH